MVVVNSPPPGCRLLNCIDKYLLNILLSLEYLLNILLSFVLSKLNVLSAGFCWPLLHHPLHSRESFLEWVSDTGSHYGLPVPFMGFLGGSDSQESACNTGDQGLIPGSGRSPGEGNGYLFQYSCLENSMDRRDWWATGSQDHRITKSLTRSSA